MFACEPILCIRRAFFVRLISTLNSWLMSRHQKGQNSEARARDFVIVPDSNEAIASAS